MGKTSDLYSNCCKEDILRCKRPHNCFYAYRPYHNFTVQSWKIIQWYGKTFIWLWQSPWWSVFDDVIGNIKTSWPEVWMVQGSPRRSDSNCGIEHMNLIMNNKLYAWKKDNNSQSSSVGCKIVHWSINTQSNKAIGNQTPCQLTFGQIQWFGVLNLPLLKWSTWKARN